MPSRNEPQRYEGVEGRVQGIGVGLTLAMALLWAQFWWLQVVNLNEFARMADQNRVSQKRLAADRGVICAANGEILADNRACADAVFVPGECPKERLGEVAAKISELIGVDTEWLLKRVADHRGAPFTQIILKRDLTRADFVRVEERQHALPGLSTVVRPQRRYHYGETAGQLLGFLGEINDTELEGWREEGYKLGDLVGKDGLERQYEKVLHGQDGYMLVTKYASGQPQLRTDRTGRPYIARRDTRGHLLDVEAPPVRPKSGGALHLTLDLGLQRRCEELLRGEVGAVVVLEADTGGVLAMASSPGYDPGVFVTRGHNEERAELLSGKKPNRMTHRAFREVYPPGSVFKIVLAAAALEEGLVTPKNTFFCPGRFALDGASRYWHCWKRSGHGAASVDEALAFSCDVFFYNVGLKLGVDKISKWSHAMGLGEPTGLDLPGETAGLIPDREWKQRVFADKQEWDRRWYNGDTVNLSIGQGSACTTPLQNAVMMAAIVNGGRRVRPFLAQETGPLVSDPMFSEATMETVRAGLRRCVEDGPPPPTGTGHAAFIPGFDIIGKTGSAQVMSLAHHEQYATEEDIPWHMRDHAWFVAGVLDREPRIALCILIEHGHHGSSVAAPHAKDVISYFYGERGPESPAAAPAAEE